MKPKIISSRINTIQYKAIHLDLDGFKITENYQDGKLIRQEWRTNQGFKVSHPSAYRPGDMHFLYYDDISFLKSKECLNIGNYWEMIPDPIIVTDWDAFKGFNHVLCIYLYMDGNIYEINNPQPIKIWRHFDYISGITNDEYDLNKAIKILKNIKDIRNIKIIDIPHYNQDISGTQAIEFDYKRSTRTEFRAELKTYNIFSNIYVNG